MTYPADIDRFRKLAWMELCAILISLAPAFCSNAAVLPEVQQATISADLAAGVDMGVILKKVVEMGMPVDQVVETMILAGADPVSVVNSAACEKCMLTTDSVNSDLRINTALSPCFSIEDVLKGAVNALKSKKLSDAAFQTAITLMATAAVQAGAGEAVIYNALAAESIPSDVIANAVTQAVKSPAPVEGYTAPAAEQPRTASVLGATPSLSIGGSTIGDPKTLPASRSVP